MIERRTAKSLLGCLYDVHVGSKNERPQHEIAPIHVLRSDPGGLSVLVVAVTPWCKVDLYLWCNMRQVTLALHTRQLSFDRPFVSP